MLLKLCDLIVTASICLASSVSCPNSGTVWFLKLWSHLSCFAHFYACFEEVGSATFAHVCQMPVINVYKNNVINKEIVDECRQAKENWLNEQC